MIHLILGLASPTDIAEHLGDFLFKLVDLLWMAVDSINTTTAEIDKIKFDGSVFESYLGYAKYAMGTPLYATFSSVILISVGVTLWTYILKGIGYLKNLLPW